MARAKKAGEPDPAVTRPRVIGVLGGASDQATAVYYRLLNQGARTRLGGSNTAEILIDSMNFALLERWVRDDLWAEAGENLKARAQGLERAGAGLLICTANTLHRVADAFTAGLRIPFLHIVDPTATAIRAAGLQRVALLGTRPVMATDFLQRRYAEQFGIQILVPEPDEQDEVHRIIFGELCHGRFTAESKAYCLGVVDRLHERGAAGAILGCTELPFLISQADRPRLPMFDTAALHAEAAVEQALAPPRSR